MSTRSLSGKIIYLTGATRGIGRAVALRLAPEGALLALCGRDKAALEEVKSEALRLGARSVFSRAFDLRDEGAVESFYQGACKELGPPDILINNAGYNERKAYLWETTTEEFDRMVAVNLRAPYLLMRLAFGHMKEKGGGHVVNILSTVCHFDNERMSIYTATKKGLQGLTDVFRKEARPHNIAVTSIYPGGVDTDFRPQKRPDYMRPESVAEAVVAVLKAPEDLIVHHLTFRPQVETNF